LNEEKNFNMPFKVWGYYNVDGLEPIGGFVNTISEFITEVRKRVSGLVNRSGQFASTSSIGKRIEREDARREEQGGLKVKKRGGFARKNDREPVLRAIVIVIVTVKDSSK
jgi:hypothetical protein